MTTRIFFKIEIASTIMKSINITIEIIKIIVNKAFPESFGKKALIIIVTRKKAKEIILAIHPVTAGHTGL